jgi:hypothetical protein
MPGFIGRLTGAGPRAWIVIALGLGAAVLMVATEFSTIHEVKVGASTCGALDTAQQRDICDSTGIEQHGGALLVLGLFAAVLALGAGVGRSRPAAVALLAIGITVFAVALLLDRPTLDDTQDFTAYADTVALTGGGYTLELIAGALAVLAAAVALLWERVPGVPVPRLRLPRRRSSGAPDASDEAPAGPADSKA